MNVSISQNFEDKVTIVSADLQQAREQNATGKNLSEGVKTAIALQKTASQQSNSNYVKEHEKLVADKDANDMELWKYWPDMDTKIS